jgi:hypothetical protein
MFPLFAGAAQVRSRRRCRIFVRSSPETHVHPVRSRGKTIV